MIAAPAPGMDSDGDVGRRRTAPGGPEPPGDALVLRDVDACYGHGQILEDFDLRVPCGACWAVVGPSGAGKTTLLRVILGTLVPCHGTVMRPALETESGSRRGSVGYIPQNLGLVRNRTALQNVLLGALNRLPWWRTLTGRFPTREARQAEEALCWVGLRGRGGERIERLSGGERRRVAVARALLQRPDVLLADEFLAEVDRVTSREIIDLLERLRESTGMTLLFVDHDIENACRIADRVVVLSGGSKIRELEASRVDPSRVRELFRMPAMA